MRLVTLVLVSVLLAAVRPLAAEDALVVIVHRQRSVSASREEIARIYLKQRLFWSDGSPIVAVNRESRSPAREIFSQRVLGRSSTDLAAYWNQQYFQGVFPPLTLSSAASVKRYVATERNAVGYIEESEVDDTVKVILKVP
jgi:ABC-type phosphate transport system substrate-binding protein